MYIKTNNYVIDFFSKFEKEKNIKKLEFMVYIIDSIKNDLVNEKNIVNINLIDEEVNVFNFKTIGYMNNEEDNLIEYLLSVFSRETGLSITHDNSVINYDFDNVSEYIFLFERSTFFEKLDVIAELFIRYDYDTLFNNEYMSIFPNISGYDFANNIKGYIDSLK